MASLSSKVEIQVPPKDKGYIAALRVDLETLWTPSHFEVEAEKQEALENISDAAST